MPAQVRQAAFMPIAPFTNLEKLVEESENFEYVARVPYEMIQAQGYDALDKLILLHVILGGKPLVIEGFQERLPRHLFSHAWLEENHGTKVESPRDLGRHEFYPMTIGNYLRNMSKLTEQFHAQKHSWLNPDIQRLYLKDIDTPEAWSSYLKDLIPPGLFYLNESTGEMEGPGAVDEETGPYGTKVKGRGVAPAGDLMSSLPPSMRADNMMCYIGHEGTYTPAHREMCATLGHNIMVETSGNAVDRWGKPEKPGSSIWFMTETKDRHLVSEYWLSILGHDIEVESHFAQVQAWKNAAFKTYVVEQKLGDYILIPPLAPHQVWNRGTRTMKVAWNRTTVETLEMALNEALPRARMVCRDEQYKCKAIIYFSLLKYAALLERVDPSKDNGWSAAALEDIHNSRKIGQLRKDFERLFKLYTDVVLSEMFAPDGPKEKKVEFLPFDSNVTCAYCRCNIFNRFLTCKTCVISVEGQEDDAYDVCMECYAMGRSCTCISGLKWVEQFSWKELVESHDELRHLIISLDGGVTAQSPQSIVETRKRLQKKTLAQICQEQLKMRPFRDPSKPDPRRSEEAEEDDDDDGQDDAGESGRKKRRRSSKKGNAWKKTHANCHICKHQEALWKLARCGCGRAYCYGTLFRAFDLMPQQIMEKPDWKCPRCLKICSCGSCRKDPAMDPYDPSGTLVGHDTKLVADPRSVESLVDFSRSNLVWIERNAEDDNEGLYESTRLRRLREQAEREKARDETLNEAYVDADQPFRSGYITEASMDDAPHETTSVQQAAYAVDPQLQRNHNSDGMYLDRDAGNSAWHHYGQQPDTAFGPLPPPAAMLGGAPPPYSSRPATPSDNQWPAQTVYPRTLTTLERDPQAFLASAGLAALQDQESSRSQHASSFAAPIANMTAGTPLNSGDRPGQQQEASADEPESTPKRRRMGSMSNAEGPMGDANRQYQQAQLQKTLAEAKTTDSYHITRARLQGKRKLVKLSIGTEQVKLLEEGERQKEDRTRPGPALGLDGACDDAPADTIVVRSDIPKRTAMMKHHLLPMLGGKGGRPAPQSQSADRKRPGRPSTNYRGSGGKKHNSARRSGGRWVDMSDASGGDKASESSAEDDRFSNRTQSNGPSPSIKKQRESAHLARKRQQDGEAVRPLELLTPQSRKRSSATKRVQQAPTTQEGRVESDVEEATAIQKKGKPPPGPKKGGRRSAPKQHVESEEDEPYIEVDENYNPIPVVTASLTNGISSRTPTKAKAANLSGPVVDVPTRAAVKPRGGVKGGGPGVRATSAVGSSVQDSYRDAKMMALRVAEGEVSDGSVDFVASESGDDGSNSAGRAVPLRP
ncbi:MAG: hypothetical protein M1832_002987 [Thelocarpon impressellum]|nr:MAG: hypothetical protein M1832_002987 [Thelocarpon impressellum]